MSFGRPPPIRNLSATLWLVAVLALAACDLVAGPSADDEFPPQMALEVLPVRLDSLWVLRFGMLGPYMADAFIFQGVSSETWTPDVMPRRGRVVVTASNGDREEVLFGPLVCEDPATQGRYACNSMLITVASETSNAGLQQRISRYPGQWILPHICVGDACQILPSGSYRLMANIFAGDLGRAIRKVSRWPGVIRVEPEWIATLGILPQPPIPTWYQGGLPFRASAPETGNGILEAVPGDTISVEYTDRDGKTVKTSVTIPP